jgi:hypothetical protein
MKTRLLAGVAVFGFSFAAAAQTSTTTTNTSSASSTTTTTTAEVTKKSPWGVEILLETEQDNTTIHDTTVKQYNFFSGTYAHSDRFKSKLRLEIDNEVIQLKGGEEAKQSYDRWILGDVAYTFSDGKFLKGILPDSIQAVAFARIYAPTSKASRDQGMITRIRPQAQLTYEAGPAYVAYFQRNDLYPREDFAAAGKPQGFKAFDNFSHIDLGVTVAPGLKVFAQNGILDEFFYGNGDLGISSAWTNKYYQIGGLNYSFLDSYEIEARVEHYVNVNDLGTIYKTGSETAAYLDLSASF